MSTLRESILEVVQGEWIPTTAIVERTQGARPTVSELLNALEAEGLLQKQREGAAMEWRRLDGRRNWLQMPVWQPKDGPARDVFVHHRDGSRCAWSCAWLMPAGVKLPGGSVEEMPLESLWWEAIDILGRYGNLRVSQGPWLGEVIARCPTAQLLKGGDVRNLQQLVQLGRSLYGEKPYIHPSTIVKTGDKQQPLALDFGGRLTIAGLEFRPNFDPPARAAKALLNFREIRVKSVPTGRLNDKEENMLRGLREEFALLNGRGV